jgi:hypothetical protein
MTRPSSGLGIGMGLRYLGLHKLVLKLARQRWSRFQVDHFKAYIWSAVVAHNLVLFARRQLA